MKDKLSERLTFYMLCKDVPFKKEERNALLSEYIEQAKENEELVQKAIDALGNCNEDICPCVEDVMSYLESILGEANNNGRTI